MVVSFESRRHRGACLGVDAVGYGMVFLVVFPPAECGEHAHDFLDQSTKAGFLVFGALFGQACEKVLLRFPREACFDHVRWRSGERHNDFERRQLW